MGYTHNFNIKLPVGQHAQALQAIEIDLRARFSATMAIEMDDDGALSLNSLDGASEGFTISGAAGDSVKTGRGLAELDIAEILWRTSSHVRAHGGSMAIISDWVSTESASAITHDASVALAVLMHRCADLLQGKRLQVKGVSRAWPQVSEYRDFAVEERYMRRDLATVGVKTKYSNVPDQLIFGIDADGEVDYTQRHEPGSLKFDYLVTRHIQAARLKSIELQAIRGFCFADIAVYLDDVLIAGKPVRNHSAVDAATCNLTPLVPNAQWLMAEEGERREDVFA